MRSPITSVNRLMRDFKHWTENAPTSDVEQNTYKKIIQTMEQLKDEELKLFYARYVVLAKYNDKPRMLTLPKMPELAKYMDETESVTRKILSSTIHNFCELHFSEGDKIRDLKRNEENIARLEIDIERASTMIELYTGWLKQFLIDGYSKDSYYYSYFKNRVDGHESNLVKDKEELQRATMLANSHDG